MMCLTPVLGRWRRPVRSAIVLACGLTACCLAAQQPTIEQQADAIHDLVLETLEAEQPYWPPEYRDTIAEAFRAAVLSNFPEGMPEAKQAAIESWIADFCHSNYPDAVPATIEFQAAVVGYVVGDIADTPEMTEEEQAQLDRQIAEFATELRAALLTKLPVALAPHVGLEATFIAAEFEESVPKWVDEFTARAERESTKQSTRGLKRPLTPDEYQQALDWLRAAVTDPSMPNTTPRREQATPAEKMELADWMGRITALQSASHLHTLTRRPEPEEITRLRETSGRIQSAAHRYRPYLNTVSAALLLCIGSMAQEQGEALPLPWP